MPKLHYAKERISVSPKGWDNVVFKAGDAIPEAIYKKYEGIEAFTSKVESKTVSKAKAEAVAEEQENTDE